MIEFMNGTKNIMDSLIVGAGTVTTWTLSLFNAEAVTGIKDAVTIAVGLATLVFTIYKILEIRAKRKARLEADKRER